MTKGRRYDCDITKGKISELVVCKGRYLSDCCMTRGKISELMV